MTCPATGVPMSRHVVRTRFVPDSTPGRPKFDAMLSDSIPEIRRLLRTDLSLQEIALQLGVSAPTLRHFIRRRQICDIAERAKFIGRQRNIAGVA